MSQPPSQQASRSDRIEQWAKIASLVAIPLAVALVGAIVQDAVSARAADTEFAKLAISILTDKDASAAPFRPWAVQVLDASTPGGLDSALRDQLARGDVTLPRTAGITQHSLDSPGDPSKGEVFMCPGEDEIVVSCSTFRAPSGSGVCGTQIEGRACKHSGCTRLERPEFWRTTVICMPAPQRSN